MVVKCDVIIGIGTIGGPLMRYLVEKGNNIIVFDSDPKKITEANDFFERNGLVDKVKLTSVLDIRDVKKISDLIQYLSDNGLILSSVIITSYPRSAAYGVDFESVSAEDFCEHLASHVGGYFNCCRAFANYMAGTMGGSIVLFSSIYGSNSPRFEIYEGTAMTVPVEYAVSKAGIEHLARYCARYFSGKRVRFNSIAPGGVFDNQPQSFVERYNFHKTGKGMLSPEDLFETVFFLISNGSSMINGQNIIVDDGWTL